MRFYGLAAATMLATLRDNQLDQLRKIDREEQVNQAVQRFLVTKGAPGASVGVTVNGKTVLARGYGFADVENGRPCTKDTVMRIASISKPLTAAIAGKLLEMGKIELDSSIYNYVPDFPKKKFEGKEVDITIRQLLSHTSGIRHYKKIYEDDELPKWDKLFDNYGSTEKDAEFLYRNVYKTTEEAVGMFKNDDLVAKPGTKFVYTTHGFTLLGLCLEKAAGGEKFDRLASKLFNELGMHGTKLDTNQPLISNRAKFYRRNMHHTLVNVPEVDCTYKHPSGGILSNVEDLLKFANAMLLSYQSDQHSTFLKSSTVHKFWDDPVEGSRGYVLGWTQMQDDRIDKTENKNRIWYHTGASVGVSSILLIKSNSELLSGIDHPQGVCVAILVNLQNADPTKLAMEIVDIFEEQSK